MCAQDTLSPYGLLSWPNVLDLSFLPCPRLDVPAPLCVGGLTPLRGNPHKAPPTAQVRTRSTCVADSRRSGSPIPVEADRSPSKWINFLPEVDRRFSDP